MFPGCGGYSGSQGLNALMPSLRKARFKAPRVTCPWHGADFDIKTGAVLGPPAQNSVPSYKVMVDGDDIKVEV
jgi:nitrite reductase/ring-hydroxylating ferredoxin subunit